eukprot:jgi/Undpi1/8660/HiC_scaffold_25.g11125.m1
MASSSRPSTRPSQLGSQGWCHGLGSPGSTPRPRPQSTFFCVGGAGGGCAGDVRPSMPGDSESDDANSSEGRGSTVGGEEAFSDGGWRGYDDDEEGEEEEEEETAVNEEDEMTSSLLAAAAAALSQVSGEQRAPPLSFSPAGTTPPGDNEEVEKAEEAGMKEEEDSSPASSALDRGQPWADTAGPGFAGVGLVEPYPVLSSAANQDHERLKETRYPAGVGAGVGLVTAVAVTPLGASSEGEKNGSKAATSTSTQPPSQPRREPPPHPTHRARLERARTPPQKDVLSDGVPSASNPGDTYGQPLHVEEEKEGQLDHGLTLDESVVSSRSIVYSVSKGDGQEAAERGAKEKGEEEEASVAELVAAVAAVVSGIAEGEINEETKVESSGGASLDRSAPSSLDATAAATRSTKYMAVKAAATPLAAARAAASAALGVVGGAKEATPHEEIKKRTRSSFSFIPKLSNSAGGSRVGPRTVAATAGAPPSATLYAGMEGTPSELSAAPAIPPAMPSAEQSVKDDNKVASFLRKAKPRSAGGGDEARKPEVASMSSRSAPGSGLLVKEEEKGEEAEGADEEGTQPETRVYTETAYEFWAHAKEEDARAGAGGGDDSGLRVARQVWLERDDRGKKRSREGGREGRREGGGGRGREGGRGWDGWHAYKDTVEDSARIPPAASGDDSARTNGPSSSQGMYTFVEAVLSGDPSAVGMVVGIVGKAEAATQLSALRKNGRHQLETVVMLAAKSGDVDMFHAVLRCLSRTLTNQQLADVLEARGRHGRSLLTAAAEGGSETVFGEVSTLLGGMDKIGGGVSAVEGRCLVRMAAKGGNAAVFKRAMDAVLMGGKRAGANAIAMGEDLNETTVLVEAARSGVGAVVDAVVAYMNDLLTQERVVVAITSCSGPRRVSALMVAAESRSVEAVTAVMKAVSAIGVDTKTSDVDSDSSSAQGVSGAAGRTAFSSISGKLHSRSAWRRPKNSKSGRSTMSTVPSPDQNRTRVIDMITGKDLHGMTALSYATNSGVMEIIKIVSASMSGYLPAAQLIPLIASIFSSSVASSRSRAFRKPTCAQQKVLTNSKEDGGKVTSNRRTHVCDPCLSKFTNFQRGRGGGGGGRVARARYYIQSAILMCDFFPFFCSLRTDDWTTALQPRLRNTGGDNQDAGRVQLVPRHVLRQSPHSALPLHNWKPVLGGQNLLGFSIGRGSGAPKGLVPPPPPPPPPPISSTAVCSSHCEKVSALFEPNLGTKHFYCSSFLKARRAAAHEMLCIAAISDDDAFSLLVCAVSSFSMLLRNSTGQKHFPENAQPSPPPPSWYIPPWDDAPVQQKRWDRVTAVFLAFFRRPFCPLLLLLLLLFCVSFVVFQESLLGAVSSAKNPFIPGINLSVALTGAARRAVEGEKRALLSMQAAVDELLLEVLEHLPQTVRGFEGEMKACSAVFEPETVMASHRGMMGPLSVALQKRQQMDTYCTIPLVLDFMSRKFTKGLPSLRDTGGVLENNQELSNPGQTLYGKPEWTRTISHGRILFLGMVLQRGYGEGKLSSITYFPGARFIIAGLLARPDSYYKVPALRMVLDLVTYLSMMWVFGAHVLVNDDDEFDWAEIVFAIYICGAILTEFKEIAEDPWEYVRDRWNVLDVISLCLMFMGLWFRALGEVNSIAATSLYALSAPLAFTRILFFAQILPSQGPMIQVIFSMTGELVKFGAVMLVVMGGFVMSFYSLLKDTMTYGEVWQNVFKAMLGETDFFDEFSGSQFDSVATVLLATYLVILTIMMLNLLVAVLSTAHARVDQNADQEYKVSKARLIQHYVSVVEIDRLPAPFNLMQWVLCFPMLVADWCFSTTLYRDTKRFFGRAVFWAMLGPLAVAAGSVLWVVSVLKAVTVVWRTSAGNTLGGKLARVTLTVLCCLVGAPVWLLVLWIKGALTGMRRVAHRLMSTRGGRRLRRGGAKVVGREDTAGKPAKRSSIPEHSGQFDKTAHDELDDVVVVMLGDAEGGLGVGDLQRYLDDPMSDPDVRRDEETRATTVEHIKLLRNRLEATTKGHMMELRSYLVQATEELSRNVEGAATVGGSEGRGGGLEDMLRATFGELDRKFDSRTAKLEEKIGALIEDRLGAVARKLDLVIRKPAE